MGKIDFGLNLRSIFGVAIEKCFNNCKSAPDEKSMNICILKCRIRVEKKKIEALDKMLETYAKKNLVSVVPNRIMRIKELRQLSVDRIKEMMNQLKELGVNENVKEG